MEELLKHFTQTQLEGLAWLAELHKKLYDGPGLTDDEDFEYQAIIDDLKRIIPLRD